MHLLASRTLAADSRRHYQLEMLHAADDILGKYAADLICVCFHMSVRLYVVQSCYHCSQLFYVLVRVFQ